MHMLSARYRSEFLATPQLVRFIHAQGAGGFEPTLLIKASTVLLKYVVQGVPMSVTFRRLRDRLMYAVTIHDDARSPAVLWSPLEYQEERDALQHLSKAENLPVFLFNELTVNVAWASMPVRNWPDIASPAASASIGPVSHSRFREEMKAVLDNVGRGAGSDPTLMSVDLPSQVEWTAIRSSYVTNRLAASHIDLFSQDEGGQQEQMALWLTDNLQPLGVHLSPQVPDGPRTRELTDVLMSYEYGSVLIESKALQIFDRSPLPSRAKLAKSVTGHLEKAVRQLRGGMRRLKQGTPVAGSDGRPINVEREHPPHGIILVPDLALVVNRDAYGRDLICEFMKVTGGFLHIVDIAELLRVVQAAEMISARGESTTPMMAFDFYLIERIKKAMEADTLCIEILLRFEGGGPTA